MDTEEKKAFLLLKSIIFQYHGLDESEQKLLEKTALDLDAQNELQWAMNFISEDFMTAFTARQQPIAPILLPPGPVTNSTEIFYWPESGASGTLQI